MKSRLCKLLFSASLIFTLCGSAQAAVVFSNGFESPTVPVGGFFIYAPGATFGPWTAVGIAASSVISGSFTQSGITFLAQEGNQWADLAGSNSNSTEGFGTSISTVVGQFYDVSFWVGNVINPGGFFGISTTVNAFVNGLPAFTAVNTSGNGTTQTWQHYNFQTLATSATTTFRRWQHQQPRRSASSTLIRLAIISPDLIMSRLARFPPSLNRRLGQ
jgi:hypothetical protein